MDKKYLAKIIATDNEGLQMISACTAGGKIKVAIFFTHEKSLAEDTNYVHSPPKSPAQKDTISTVRNRFAATSRSIKQPDHTPLYLCL